jgi:hypothetical protein
MRVVERIFLQKRQNMILIDAIIILRLEYNFRHYVVFDRGYCIQINLYINKNL